jgi:hypothetical protein
MWGTRRTITAENGFFRVELPPALCTQPIGDYCMIGGSTYYLVQNRAEDEPGMTGEPTPYPTVDQTAVAAVFPPTPTMSITTTIMPTDLSTATPIPDNTATPTAVSPTPGNTTTLSITPVPETAVFPANTPFGNQASYWILALALLIGFSLAFYASRRSA